MPQYGRLSKTFQNAQGQPLANLVVVVRKQGATVNGLHSGAQTSFTVNDPGGITDSPADQLQVGVDDSVTRAVSSVAATNVTVGATGFSNVADDARLTPTTNLPSLYADARGGEAAVLPLKTDSQGEIVDANGAYVWAPVVPYDLHISGANYQTILLQDVLPDGHEAVVSNIFPSATSVAFQKDTLRAQVSGSVLEQWMSAGAVKFSIALTAALEAVLSSHHVVGPLTLDSGDFVMGAAVSQLVPGATSFAIRNHADTLDNLIILDSGAATLRATLTMTAGNLSQTGVASGIAQTGGLGANTLTQPTTMSGNATVSGSGKRLIVTATLGILNSGGPSTLTGGAIQRKTWNGFADADTTPSVSGGNDFQANNTAPTSITNFDDGPNGAGYVQEITIWFTNGNTTIVHDVTKIRLVGGANFVGTTADTLTLVADNSTPTIWYEKARSVNS